jgi:multiple sugar transport system substrate-binding protein
MRLAVVGWDHDRCMRSLRALGEGWERRRPGVEVSVTARPGTAFAEQPLGEATQGIDVISIDHPFVGAAAQHRSLAPLDELLPPDQLDALCADAIGASHESYAYDGHQWALATDAACQVAVVRDDLLGAASTPTTWDDVLALAGESGGRVGMSFRDHDLVCALLSLAEASGSHIEPANERFADPAVALPAIARLAALARTGHPVWEGSVLDRMAGTNDVLYVPLQWGYVTHSRPDAPGNRLRFADAPASAAGIGSTLGGAGLAVSSESAHPEEAAHFAAWASGAEAQRKIVASHGGQPGSRTVWDDPDFDVASGGFYSGTRATIDAAVVRPCEPWWPDVQRECGQALERALRKGREPEVVLAGVEQTYREVRERHHNDPRGEER